MPGRDEFAPRAGVKLDDCRADVGGTGDLVGVGGHEQRDADAGRAQLLDLVREVDAAADHVEPALGGAFLTLFRHQAGGVREHIERQRHHLVGRGHLVIQRDVQQILQAAHVVVANVPAILAQVCGDAIGAGGAGQHRGANRIGIETAPRITHGGDMIDIHAQADRRHRHQLGHRVHAFAWRPRLPGFTAGMAASSGGSASAE